MSLDLESARADERRAGAPPDGADVTTPVHVVRPVEDPGPVTETPLTASDPENTTDEHLAEPDTAEQADTDTDTDTEADTEATVSGRRRRDRVVIAALAALALVAGADAIPSRGGEPADHTLGGILAYQPVPGAQPLDLDHPQEVLLSPRSVTRYLDQVANGERIREQQVVADAAAATRQRAGLAPAPVVPPAPAAPAPAPGQPSSTTSTLEQAKREAAAAAAGQWQPWMGGSPSALAAAGIGGIAPGANGFVVPARGTFSSGFGPRWGTLHQGIDIANAIGTPIYAVAAGTVIDAGPASGFGLWVRIRHDDGTITVYGHMYDFFVSVGERVPAGMQIARIGNRGDSSGPHLHFEVIVNGQHVDPQLWLAQRGISLTS